MRFLKYAFVMSVALFLSACGEDPLSASITVKYQITGSTGAVNIDYIDSNGDLVILNGQELPWEITFSANKGEQAYLSAKRTGSSGTVTVKIYSNGSLRFEDTSADGSAATAEGTL